jgi:bisphosphoglycerate-dependent phosphoglycerate mutase
MNVTTYPTYAISYTLKRSGTDVAKAARRLKLRPYREVSTQNRIQRDWTLEQAQAIAKELNREFTHEKYLAWRRDWENKKKEAKEAPKPVQQELPLVAPPKEEPKKEVAVQEQLTWPPYHTESARFNILMDQLTQINANLSRLVRVWEGK